MVNILILGAAGFIGTNLVKTLAVDKNNNITLVDVSVDYFNDIKTLQLSNIDIVESEFNEHTDFDSLLKGQDVVYHLVSTTVPTNSNQQIPLELSSNVVVTAMMLDACVRCGIKKVIFISSGGTVYGKEGKCPLPEDTPAQPITSYGIQKVSIEKLLYLYQYLYGLDYRIVRLANPYGPYQRPNGILGAVTTFTYKALKGETISVYGDGSVIRDYIYIEDAINAIIHIAEGECEYRIFNVGSGRGTSIKELLEIIEKELNISLSIEYKLSRKVDVPVNYLDISRYEGIYGQLNTVSLAQGIRKTAKFMKGHYNI